MNQPLLNGNVCAICQMGHDGSSECTLLVEGTGDQVLDCGHVFHDECVTALLRHSRNNARCPCCVRPVLGRNAFLPSEYAAPVSPVIAPQLVAAPVSPPPALIIAAATLPALRELYVTNTNHPRSSSVAHRILYCGNCGYRSTNSHVRRHCRSCHIPSRNIQPSTVLQAGERLV